MVVEEKKKKGKQERRSVRSTILLEPYRPSQTKRACHALAVVP